MLYLICAFFQKAQIYRVKYYFRYFWYLNGTLLEPDTDNGFMYSSDSGQIRLITEGSRRLAGTYQCTAKNEVSVTRSTYAEVVAAGKNMFYLDTVLMLVSSRIYVLKDG